MRFLALTLRRVASGVLVLFGITIVTFLLVHALHGDPARALAGTQASATAVAAIRSQLGLDHSLFTQYWDYLRHLVHGNLGYSYTLGTGVGKLIVARLPTTILLVAYAGVLAVLIGVPVASIAAVRRNRAADHLTRGALVIVLGMPSFWLGLLLVAYPAVRWGIFPSGGVGHGFLGGLYHLFLPALTLSLTFLAVFVRSLRASLIDVLSMDFVAMARLKGIRGSAVYVRHVMRNALRPAVTILGLNVSYLLGSSVIVESVFAVNGIGNTLVQAVNQRDYLVVQGIALVFGAVVLGVSLLVDIVQAALDPRVGVT